MGLPTRKRLLRPSHDPRRVRSISVPKHWQLVILERLHRLSKPSPSAIRECRPSPLALDETMYMRDESNRERPLVVLSLGATPWVLQYSQLASRQSGSITPLAARPRAGAVADLSKRTRRAATVRCRHMHPGAVLTRRWPSAMPTGARILVGQVRDYSRRPRLTRAWAPARGR